MWQVWRMKEWFKFQEELYVEVPCISNVCDFMNGGQQWQCSAPPTCQKQDTGNQSYVNNLHKTTSWFLHCTPGRVLGLKEAILSNMWKNCTELLDQCSKAISMCCHLGLTMCTTALLNREPYLKLGPGFISSRAFENNSERPVSMKSWHKSRATLMWNQLLI